MMAGMPGEYRLYQELADWWPLISPPGEYAAEAAYLAGLFTSADIEVRDVLDLGSGGGHVAVHLKDRLNLTLVDLSAGMLAVSRRLNPECAHRQGDMCTVRLGRVFDAVLVHDAVDYVTDEDDLRQLIATAFAHCRPGGMAVFVPDHTAETFQAGTGVGGSTDAAGRQGSFRQWTWDPDPADDWIQVEVRYTDWYRVRTDGGKVGWVSRQQLETTLTAGGIHKSFRDIMLDDFLSRRVQLGAAWGHFKGEPILKLYTSYRLSETLSVEGTIGQVQGVFSGTNLWHLNLNAEPWADRRFSPFVGIGVGKFTNYPNLSLVGAATTNAKLANAVIGVRYYLTERFVLRADYSLYTVFVNDAQTNEYRAWTAGVSFFF